MRGRRDPQPSLFYAIDVEARIRPDHPLRPIKAAVDRILAGLSDRFDAAYSDTGRPPGVRADQTGLTAPVRAASGRSVFQVSPLAP
jgi:hypothetical protein